jgi:hypothetical protein
MCPQTKSLGCSFPWSMRPLDDAALGQIVLWTKHASLDMGSMTDLPRSWTLDNMAMYYIPLQIY